MSAPRMLLLSDLHLEFQEYEPCQEGYDLVVLAGDIHTRERGVSWAREKFSCPVVYVRGNHEGYGTHWEKNLDKMKALAEGSNVHVLEKETLVLDGVRFLGATGWTDFSAWPDRAEAMKVALSGRDFYGAGMRDYRKIRTGGYRKLHTRDTATWAIETRRWLEGELAKPFAGPTVIVTHHPPSVLSLPDRRAVEPIDAADANTWDDLVASSGAVFWCHGHTHHPTRYRLGETDIITNPRGYPGQNLAHDKAGIFTIARPRPTPRP